MLGDTKFVRLTKDTGCSASSFPKVSYSVHCHDTSKPNFGSNGGEIKAYETQKMYFYKNTYHLLFLRRFSFINYGVKIVLVMSIIVYLFLRTPLWPLFLEP